jgi:hypothetical protein
MGTPAATADVDPTEAVIISGARRGEIILLDADVPVDWTALNEQLDSLNQKLTAVSREIRACSKALKSGK